MAKEVRRLVFDLDELKAVVEAYLARPGVRGPKGKVNDLFLRDGAPPTGLVHLQSRDGRQLTREIDEAFLIAAVLNKCHEFNVPICRAAQKHFRQLSGDAGWALDMAMGQAFPARPALVPDRKAG